MSCLLDKAGVQPYKWSCHLALAGYVHTKVDLWAQ